MAGETQLNELNSDHNHCIVPFKRYRSIHWSFQSTTINLQEERINTHGYFINISTDIMQHIFGFISLNDRFAFLSTRKDTLKTETFTREYTSYCLDCVSCQRQNYHLCEYGESKSIGFYHSLLQYSGLNGLQELRLANDNNFLEALCKREEWKTALQHLKVLELHKMTQFNAIALQILAISCKELKVLRFQDMVLHSEHLKALICNNQSSLECIDFLGCHTLTSDDVRALKRCGLNLKELSLWGCHNVKNEAIAEVVSTCSNLERLNLRYCHQVNDTLVATIAQNLPHLKHLNLRYCYKVSDKGVEHLCRHLPALETLNLSQCAKLTDVSIFRLVHCSKQLKELRLWGCTKLTSVAMSAISKDLPLLSLVDIRSKDQSKVVLGGSFAPFLPPTTTLIKPEHWQQAEQEGIFTRCLVTALAV